MTTTVVNVRSLPLVEGRRVIPAGVIYIGRASPRVGLAASPWANPYRVGHRPHNGSVHSPCTCPPLHDLADVFAFWDFYLKGRLEADPEWLEPLRGMALACWCKPAVCHGDAIAEWFETHPLVPKPGERIEFGRHRMPEADAEEAPAWPSRAAFAKRLDDRHRRELRRGA